MYHKEKGKQLKKQGFKADHKPVSKPHLLGWGRVYIEGNRSREGSAKGKRSRNVKVSESSIFGR